MTARPPRTDDGRPYLSAGQASARLRELVPWFRGWDDVTRAPAGEFLRAAQTHKHGPVFYHPDDVDALCKLAESGPQPVRPWELCARRAAHLVASKGGPLLMPSREADGPAAGRGEPDGPEVAP